MIQISEKVSSLSLFLVIATLFTLPAVAEPGGSVSVTIDQTRGVDQSVEYVELQKFGPWDDRNYDLSAADLKYLSADEHELRNQLPAFFRVELRKEWPSLRKSGPAQYPRAALQLFGIRHGGLMQNGKIEVDRRELAKKPVEVGKEVQLNAILGANEISVEINPANPMQVVAGANNAGGQEMYYSTDGGVNWTIQGVLPNTCCDPTIDWSSDGSVAYVGALSGAIGVSTWRSFDGGQTWVDRVDLTASGSDKEFIHVDQSPDSPYQDNLYVTYHNSNTMQFARSEDMGATYAIQAFGGAPSGIGSDITTDRQGNIYYVYGAFGTQTIEMLKSTDGGDTFGPASTVAATNGSFDYPIPSQESRGAWVYAATDADRSGGPFDGSVYVSWSDVTGPESGIAANNHTQVYVAYSRDGGTTWNTSIPHETADVLDVDRWNQWMTVDEFGNVHVVYYDTRNSANRSGVDLYYAISTDGAVTWSTPERVSTATSSNLTDGQEFGDYNGISVLGEKIVSVWTDNRDGPPNSRDVFADDAVNSGAAPSFTFGAAPNSLSVCAPDSLDPITVSVGSIQGFANPVTLNLANLPAGFSGGFSPNPVTPAQPANTSDAQVTVGAVATGDYSFDISGSASGTPDKNLNINVSVFDDVPAGPTLFDPLDGAVGVSTAPLLTWTAVPGATTYIVEVDDDPAFGSIDFSTQTAATSALVDTGLGTDTTYYWRVRASNDCGESVQSATFSFTTSLEVCSAPNLAIPDGNVAGVSDTLVVADTGAILDMNVSLQVAHTWVGDLIFTLVHEDTGTSVLLVDRPGVPASQFGCSADNVDATLDDEGTAPVETTCGVNPAISGSLTPFSPLSGFDGEDLSGNWRLDASDVVTQDPGTLQKWCLVPTVDVVPDDDDDNDGVPNADDQCPNTPAGEAVDANGCSESQLDDDNDGVSNADDQCPNTPAGEAVDANGCSASQLDDDNDGVSNADDQCPNTPAGAAVDANGCSTGQLDDDNDGVPNATDQCPNTPAGEAVDANGCSASQLDDDNDGVSNADDQCPNTPVGEPVDANGCSDGQLDDDNDGVPNATDQCPNTPAGEAVDANGCSASQLDDDNDGVSNADDQCPNTPVGAAVDANGCSATAYDDEAAFLSAISAPTLIDFEGQAAPGSFISLGDPGEFSESGVTFTNNSQMFLQNNDLYGTDSFLSPQGANPHIVQIALPADTVAVGFSYSSAAASAEIDGGESFDLPAVASGTLGFFGISSDAPIQFITITVAGPGTDIDNFYFVLEPPPSNNAELPAVLSLGNFNGNNKTDLGVLLRDPVSGKNKLHVMDGGSGNNIESVTFGSAPVRGSTTVPDATGDLVPEVAVLLEGSLFATVKDVVNNTLLGKPTFNANFDPVAFLSVGDVGGGVGPDVAMVGRNPSTGKVQVQIKDVASENLVSKFGFNKDYVPFAAVAVDNVGDSSAMEIAVLGIDATGKVQAQIKDAQSGNLISKFTFNKNFTPLFFAAVPNAAGKLKFLAVLGRDASGVIQAQIKRASDGTLVSVVKFDKNFDPRAFISFADSNGSGGSEIGVVGVNGAGKVRAQVKEIANGALVKLINFSASYAPVDAIAVNAVAGTGQNEIAVLGRNASDQHRLQIKDLLTGNLVNNIPVP